MHRCVGHLTRRQHADVGVSRRDVLEHIRRVKTDVCLDRKLGNVLKLSVAFCRIQSSGLWLLPMFRVPGVAWRNKNTGRAMCASKLNSKVKPPAVVTLHLGSSGHTTTIECFLPSPSLIACASLACRVLIAHGAAWSESLSFSPSAYRISMCGSRCIASRPAER